MTSGDSLKPDRTTNRDQRWGRRIFSLLRKATFASPLRLPTKTPEVSPPAADQQRLEKRLLDFNLWFIRMRWLACLVTAALIVVIVFWLEYLEREAAKPLAFLLGVLILTNLVYGVLIHRRFLKHLVEIQIGADLLIVTAMLHYSGGIENPMMFAYIFHIILSGILLNRKKCYLTVVLATVLFAGLAIAELTHAVRHYTLHVFPHVSLAAMEGEPIESGHDGHGESSHEAKEGPENGHPSEDEGHGDTLAHAAHEPVYVTSLVILQFVIMALTAYFTTTIMDRLRREEKRALEDRQRLERVVEAAGAGLLIADRKLHPVWLNHEMSKWICSQNEESDRTGLSMSDWTGGLDGPVAQTFEDRKVRVVERVMRGPGTARRYFQATIAPVTDDSGEVYQVVELVQEITRRKMVEAEMMHSGKMAVLGIMSAGIAHEIGNPLASLSARLRLLEEQRDEEFLQESIDHLSSQISRISRIVHGVSQFARPIRDEWSLVDINSVLVETLSVLKLHKHAKDCQIEYNLATQPPQTLGVRDRFIQVFLNLGLNALEVMPDGGELEIKTRSDGDYLIITFADTGPGMSEDARERLFEPFYTTKEGGLGLGLSIAHNIIDAHGGRIDVDSTPGEGTSFHVYLPERNPPYTIRSEAGEVTT